MHLGLMLCCQGKVNLTAVAGLPLQLGNAPRRCLLPLLTLLLNKCRADGNSRLVALSQKTPNTGASLQAYRYKNVPEDGLVL